MSDHCDRDNELFSACEAGDVERVCWVITDGVDPKKATNQQYFNETPVHMYSLQVRLAMEATRGGGGGRIARFTWFVIKVDVVIDRTPWRNTNLF